MFYIVVDTAREYTIIRRSGLYIIAEFTTEKYQTGKKRSENAMSPKQCFSLTGYQRSILLIANRGCLVVPQGPHTGNISSPYQACPKHVQIFLFRYRSHISLDERSGLYFLVILRIFIHTIYLNYITMTVFGITIPATYFQISSSKNSHHLR